MPYCITAVIENEAGMAITLDSTIPSTISECTGTCIYTMKAVVCTAGLDIRYLSTDVYIYTVCIHTCTLPDFLT